MSDVSTDKFAELQPYLNGLKALYSDRLRAAILFGSRARGDHRPDSDYDVAVVLDGPLESRYNEVRAIGEFAYPLRFERHIHIQSLPLSGDTFDVSTKPIVSTIKREGVTLLERRQ